jgi:hypothetical protein
MKMSGRTYYFWTFYVEKDWHGTWKEKSEIGKGFIKMAE